MSRVYQEVQHCRVCHSPSVSEVLNFGEQYLASAFVHSNADHPLAAVKVPLTVLLCSGCGLVQLGQTVDRDRLFRHYHYRSGTNPMMRDQLRDVVDDCMQRKSLTRNDYVLDVGCNDGTMLSFFSPDYRRIGIDPAANINWHALDKSIITINDYFSPDIVFNVTAGSSCQLITSIAMLYSVEDINRFVSQVKSVLAGDGVWCIQVSYLPAMMTSMSFYDVCHEHVYYFSLSTLNAVMEKNGLRIFDASLNDVNGGSLRVFATHDRNDIRRTEQYRRIMEREKQLNLMARETYRLFVGRVCSMKNTIREFILAENARGNLTIGLGASTKGNVLLQYFEIDKEILPYISDRNPEKVSLRTLGTDIEVISEERARELNPSCMLVLIWFFKDELVRREREYLRKGGKLLFPMPYCHVVTSNGEMGLVRRGEGKKDDYGEQGLEEVVNRSL